MLKILNTLSSKKEVFKPRKKEKVEMFVCGPTVYDFSHIGHARTYIVFDMIAKYLKQKEYSVFYLQNITDIDDKIIKRAKEKNKTQKEIADKFTKEYLKDMKSLGINSVTKYAKATNYIKKIISQTERLIKKGLAYQIEDGIYFNIGKFKDYGKLSGRTALKAEDAVSRIDETKEKKNKGDFCLWKKSKKGEPKWKSPWFEGRPGWHIEDTAITENFFGPQYDIHGGAQDLIFPHHEAEIAQMESISDKKPLVKYWLHSGFLTVEGKKMSKSLGNFITMRDFLKEHSSRELRLFVLKSHYRSPIDYNENELNQIKKDLNKIDEFRGRLKKADAKIKEKDAKNLLFEAKDKFRKAMENDFNTPSALASLFDLISKTNKLIDEKKLNKKDAKNILNFLKEIDKVFGFLFPSEKKEKIPKKVSMLVKEREKQRKKGNWQKADGTRREIECLGYKIKDTKKGPEIRPF